MTPYATTPVIERKLHQTGDNDKAERILQRHNRLAFIDNLRILLIILVIAQHTAITYGGSGSWYYTEPTQDILVMLVLTIFCAANQSFFMGLFFLISSYFTPGSYDRKGPLLFLRDRLLRLGVPLVFYVVLIDPFIGYSLSVTLYQYDKSFWEFFCEGVKNMRGLGTGPLWFVETLLLFAFFYVVYRLLKKSGITNRPFPSNKKIALSVLCLGLITFLIRLKLPLGWVFVPLNLQFPYFPQYIFLLVAGVACYRYDWFSQLPESSGKLWLKIAGAGIVLLPVVGILGGATTGDLTPFNGGMHWQAFVLALWESFVGIGMCIGLLYYFREKYNHQNPLKRVLTDNVYTVFIIHAPVLVVVGLAFRNITLYPLAKFALVLCVVVSLCFVISHFIIRRLPYAKRIL